MNNPLNVGIIGFGFIGKLHANAYHNLPYAFKKPAATANIQAVLRAHPGGDETLISSLDIPVVTSSPDEFYSQPLDIVDICTPNVFHREQALAALSHHKHVYCEKPLGKTLSDAREIAQAAKSSKVLTHNALMMRYIPAVRQMKSILENGGLGEIFHFRAHLFHSSYLNPQRPMSWRLRHADSGGGALADLGVHLLDLARFLLGDVSWVQCHTRTYITQRPVSPGSQQMEIVDVDDWAHCMLGMKSGATGWIEVTRVAGGTDESTGFEIIGSRGSLRVNFDDPLTADYYDASRKQWQIGVQNYPPPANLHPIDQLWPSSKQSLGFMLNAHLACAYDFLRCVQTDTPSPCDFQTGLAAQEILEAAYLSARSNGERVNLPLD